jgi:hypothetical protein
MRREGLAATDAAAGSPKRISFARRVAGHSGANGPAPSVRTVQQPGQHADDEQTRENDHARDDAEPSGDIDQGMHDMSSSGLD